jgi:ubiquinone/menaquinone biosynthesis C-methylase UbiE
VAQRKTARSLPSTLLCAEVLDGLKSFALEELHRKFSSKISVIDQNDSESIFFYYRGNIADLSSLRTVVAIYLVQYFNIPRPQAFLGHQYYHMLLEQINKLKALCPSGTFTGFRISAAGQNSSVFSRLKSELEKDTDLTYDPKEGQLFLRIRPSSLEEVGWEVLMRTSPRPLSTRSWRVYNMKGALNATIAAVMVEMTHPSSDDRFLNIMCGSGTLLIERAQAYGKAQSIIGCDIDPEALRGAQRNLQASNLTQVVELIKGDAAQLPFPSHSFNVICSDLPWGQLVGSMRENAELYPKVLAEAARVGVKGAQFLLLTHTIQLLEEILPQFEEVWKVKDVIKICQGGLHPRIYLLERL